MNRLFKPKTMRRILLFMALIFPVVYLCGGLFFALNGAHGENVLATEETSVVDFKYVPMYQLIDNVEYQPNSLTRVVDNGVVTFTNNTDTAITNPRLAFYSRVNIHKGHVYHVNKLGLDYTLRFWSSNDSITFDGVNETLEAGRDIEGLIEVYYIGSINPSASFRFVPNLFDLTEMGVTLNEFTTYFPNSYYPYAFNEFHSFPIYGVPNEQNSLFFHLFGQRNFISQLGKDVIDGTEKGFNPLNDLFRTVNDNVLHFDENDALAVFGFGYLYYAVNVIFIYEVVTIALKLLLLPLKVVDKLEVEKDA